MLTWDQISNPELDIVGIVAVLGEGSTTRNAQASALGWHHVLPRLLPAPQALLKHENDKRLPTKPGTVVGAYSGNVRFELNYFCQLLHADDLAPNQVELVKVTHRVDPKTNGDFARLKRWLQKLTSSKSDEKKRDNREDTDQFFQPGEQAYGVKNFGLLTFLSALGFCVSIGLIIGSVYTQDGFALLATLLLSFTSTVVGAASWWRLDFKEDPPKARPQRDRQQVIPDSDVVIYYPHGAFRIIRCTEQISRLYFRHEVCEYVFSDNVYRVLALTASVFLMVGLLSMGNANSAMKIAFAASYIGLNVVYWTISALNPTGSWGHWTHKYECESVPVVLPSDISPSSTPKRSVTEMSFQNVPVMSQVPISPTGTDFYGANTASPKSSRELPRTNTNGVSPVNYIRRRTVTYSDNAPPSAGSPLDTNLAEEPIVIAPNAAHPLSTVVNSSTSEFLETKKSQVEEQEAETGIDSKSQPDKKWVSAKETATDWLNKHRLISKRPPHSPPDNTQKSETFTTALWKAIAVTGSTRWLRQTHIAPDNEVWTAWITQAGKRAETRVNGRGKPITACIEDSKGRLVLPPWGYQAALSDLFAKDPDQRKRRPPPPPKLLKVVEEKRNKHTKVKGITPAIEWKLRVQAKKARQRVRLTSIRRASTSALQYPPSLSLVTENIAGRNFVGARPLHPRFHSDRFV